MAGVARIAMSAANKPATLNGLLAGFIQTLAFFAERLPARALPQVLRFDVVASFAGRVVVVIGLFDRVPGRLVGHDFSPFLENFGSKLLHATFSLRSVSLPPTVGGLKHSIPPTCRLFCWWPFSASAARHRPLSTLPSRHPQLGWSLNDIGAGTFIARTHSHREVVSVTEFISELLPTYFSTNINIRSEDTRTHYRRSVRQFGEYLGRIATLDDLTDDLCTGFILWSLRDGLTEVTANQRAKQIRAFWEWAARRRLVGPFPTFKDAPEPELMPVAWKAEELEKLFAGCAKQRGYIGPMPADLWWLSQHWWYFVTGERTEATLNLMRDEHVDLKAQVARVPAAIRKGGMKSMTYRLNDRLCELLAEVFKYPSRSGLVWERHIGVSAYYHRYRRLIASCGLPTPRGKCGPQKMRVTVLTMIEGLGGDAAAFARHSSRRVTDESYIDQALLLAMKKGVWPPNLNPEKPKGWRRWFGMAG